MSRFLADLLNPEGQPWLRNPVFENISGRGVTGKENARFPADPYHHHQRICDRQGATDRSGDPECGLFLIPMER